MLTDHRTIPKARNAAIDRLRGAAILLMVLDHLLVQTDPGHGLRYTLTRLSLPLFAGCAAAVYRGGLRPGRAFVLTGLIGVEFLLNGPLGLGLPGPALLLALCFALWSLPIVCRNEAVMAAAGLIQALYLPLDIGGYQPGLVVCWFVLGRQLVEHLGHSAAYRLPLWVGAVGRRPALWYSGHLAGLYLMSQAGWL